MIWLGSSHPDLSLSSHSPLQNPTTMGKSQKSPPLFQPLLPGALLSQLMTPSLQWLQREAWAGGGVGVREGPGVSRPSHCRTQTQNPKSLYSGPCRVQTDIPTPCPWLPVQRRVSVTPWKVLLRCTFFRQQPPFKERTITRLCRELTSGPGMGCHCLQVDSPLLESGRSTGSYKTQRQRKGSRLRSWGRD